jgi:hypothetical protein
VSVQQREISSRDQGAWPGGAEGLARLALTPLTPRPEEGKPKTPAPAVRLADQRGTHSAARSGRYDRAMAPGKRGRMKLLPDSSDN